MCDPEKAHNLLLFAGKYGFIPKSMYNDPPILVRFELFSLITESIKANLINLLSYIYIYRKANYGI